MCDVTKIQICEIVGLGGILRKNKMNKACKCKLVGDTSTVIP